MKAQTTRLPDAFAHAAALWTAAAQERLELPWGFALRTPDAPRHPDLNMLLVTQPAPDLTAAGLEATVERLGCRQADFWDAPTFERLLPQMEARGWGVHRFALMAFEGEPPEPDGRVEEIGYAELTALRREWLGAVPELAADPDFLEEALAAGLRIPAAMAHRAFCIRDGSPVAMARISGDGDIIVVDDVFTTAGHRGRGLAGALVRTAVRAALDAGATLVYLATDTEGAAQPLYERLGFRGLGVESRFLRPNGP